MIIFYNPHLQDTTVRNNSEVVLQDGRTSSPEVLRKLESGESLGGRVITTNYISPKWNFKSIVTTSRINFMLIGDKLHHLAYINSSKLSGKNHADGYNLILKAAEQNFKVSALRQLSYLSRESHVVLTSAETFMDSIDQTFDNTLVTKIHNGKFVNLSKGKLTADDFIAKQRVVLEEREIASMYKMILTKWYGFLSGKVDIPEISDLDDFLNRVSSDDSLDRDILDIAMTDNPKINHVPATMFVILNSKKPFTDEATALIGNILISTNSMLYIDVNEFKDLRQQHVKLFNDMMKLTYSKKGNKEQNADDLLTYKPNIGSSVTDFISNIKNNFRAPIINYVSFRSFKELSRNSQGNLPADFDLAKYWNSIVGNGRNDTLKFTSDDNYGREWLGYVYEDEYKFYDLFHCLDHLYN